MILFYTKIQRTTVWLLFVCYNDNGNLDKMLRKILLQKNNSLKTSLFLPVSLFLSSIFIIFTAILASTNLTTFAAPPPPSNPITLTTYTYSPTVDFYFTSSELASSTFKQEWLGVGVETNNPTGVTSYLSSIDEDTNLNHTEPTITPL